MLKIVVEGTLGEGQSAIAAEIGLMLRKHGMQVTWDDATGAFERALVLREDTLKILEAKSVTIEIKHVRVDTVEDRVDKADIIAIRKSAASYNIIKNRFGAIGYLSPKAFDELCKTHPSADILVV